jgi:uncharacterized protein (DUF305 family)
VKASGQRRWASHSGGRLGGRRLAVLVVAVLLPGCAGGSATGEPSTAGPVIFQPGAPGQETRTVSAAELAESPGPRHSEADVRFMQGMIPHHAQALEMTALVREHATTEAVRQMALRMEISQRDEIALMESWLRSRGEAVAMDGHGAHGGHGGHLMPGMLTPEQMQELREARGVEFDRLFLRYMIQHHQGAIDMVARLFMTPGAGQESTVFKFAEDVEVDQAMEIARMQSVLDGLDGRD